MKEHQPHLDLPETSLQHREIVLSKPFLKRIHSDWYNEFKNYSKSIAIQGDVVEIGSGGGFLKDVYPEVKTSDIIKLPVCDMQFSATEMPFENQSLKGIFMLNVLHHIPDNEAFFKEAERTLASGGFIYMIEPATTWFSKIIYKNFHHEPFDETVKEWKFASKGPLSDANGALPYIIFNRDAELFSKKFPELEIAKITFHTPVKYLLSGGLSKPALLPYFMYGAVGFAEMILSPLASKLALFQTIIVRRK
ncbi:MAG TPA: class I SAM-dependent methyltransferase [Chitinophagales bacterium]|nr:class I SAM-dependent methyltransferase [Chitinophagales bacterium]HNL84076.1 class I SAM-dependent methyltransferase [Chitinophagales bacterium]